MRPVPGQREGGLEERAGVVVPRVGEDAVGGAGFDHVALLHHHDLVRHGADDAQVVADEDIGEAPFALEVAQEVDDLDLDGHVEGGGGFVEDDEPGTQDHGAGDGDALALAAREFVRVAGHHGGVEADLAHDVGHHVGAVAAGFQPVDAQPLGDDLFGGHPGERLP